MGVNSEGKRGEITLSNQTIFDNKHVIDK